jgi:hypothetical protein
MPFFPEALGTQLIDILMKDNPKSIYLKHG